MQSSGFLNLVRVQPLSSSLTSGSLPTASSLAEEETAVLLIEPVGTLKTGDAGRQLTAEPQTI